MKKILILALIMMLVLSVFVACGSGGNDDSMKDDITTMLDDMSSAMSDLDESLTQGGNITSDGAATEEGLLEEIIPDDVSDITGDSTTDIIEDGTTADVTVTTE